MSNFLRKNWTMFSLVFIAASAYLGYQPFFDAHKDGIIVQILGASFGAVFLSILTYFLLNKQSEIEENKSRGQSVFEERVELYKSIMDETKNILIDGNISIKEMTQLQFMMVKLQMLSFDETIKSYTNVYQAISTAFSNTPEVDSDNETEEGAEQQGDGENDGTVITPEDKMQILIALQAFASTCREELGLSQTGQADTKVFETAMKALKQSQEAVETKKEIIKSGSNGIVKKRAQYEFQGTVYKNATLASAVFAYYAKSNPQAGATEALNAFSSFTVRGNPVLINAEEMKERNKGYAKPIYEKVKPKLADGATMAIYSAWTSNSIVDDFISFVSANLKYTIKKIERDTSNLALVPTPEEMYIPLLKALKQLGRQVSVGEWLELGFQIGGFTQERLKTIEETESATFNSVLNRTRQDLKRAGYVNNPAHGKWELTDPTLDIDSITPEIVTQRNREFLKNDNKKDKE